ncbi:rhomboid family intramembrane serine protease [Microbacterium rhizosphaerae]|uniref:Rhomboid family intramembrane serine protease n=1 Tax=Microbacterium rhizosphaerae TaxID=1678237 RepID=A0ABZ0SNW6_9MICO|nr:rhomboid family intramembrane serine protease [Microbacterium rhizosphaerae]WPR89944.1 rhomboid family intramembrane serine protease [Microbacterium rhizosphaerae]
MTSAEFADNRDNYCYRHPDRQSFVLCQRCLRTICPECQTQAPVGVICPECLANGRKEQHATQEKRQSSTKRMPRARTSTLRAFDSRPLATYWLIGITAVVFFAQQLVPALQTQLVFYAPYLYPSLTGHFEPWRPITMMFVHSGWIHVGLNMLTLWMIGRILEPLIGHGRFVAAYLISGLGGAVGVALLSFDTPVVGASGAIFGLFGALLVIGRHIGADVAGIAVVIAINLVIGFLPGTSVAWQAHVGGLITGAAVGLVLARTRALRQRRLQIVLLGTIVAALLVLLVVPVFIYG